MYWIFIALLEPIFHAMSNIVDNHLVEKRFRSPWTLLFYANLIETAILPFVWYFGNPSWPGGSEWIFLAGLGAVNTFGIYFYLKALEHNDTSVVVSLFDLGKVFVPVMAFFIVGEILAFHQYIGVAIIALSGVLLNLQPGKVRLNKAFWHMGASALLLALEAVLFRNAFETMTWGTAFFWSLFFSICIAVAATIGSGKIRAEVKEKTRFFKKHFWIFTVNELLFVAGFIGSSYAILLAPSVTVSQMISSLQPFFVLLYAVLLSSIWPVFREDVTRGSVLRKCALFVAVLFGIWLSMN